MSKLKGKRVVFSGTFDGYTRQTAEKNAVSAGCVVTKAVSKKTDILICGEEPGNKLTNAEKLDIEVLGQAEWDQLLGKVPGMPSDDDDDEADEASYHTDSPPPNIKITNLKGKRVVFSGTFDGYTRHTAEQTAVHAGCVVTKAVSRKTDILICGEEAGSKLTDAENRGVDIIYQEQWDKLVGDTPGSDDEGNETDETSNEPPTPPAVKPTKPKLKRRRTHAMSDDEEDENSVATATLTKRRSVRLDKVDSITDTITSPPAKKAKIEPQPASTSKSAKSLPKCQYWDKCYRKDLNHKKNFRHPPKGGATVDVKADDEEEAMDVDVDVAPLHDLADGDTAQVPGGLHGAQTYTVKRNGDHYSCTCTSWKMQRAASDMRTCRHLRTYLGDAFENKRIDFDEEEKPIPSRAQRHKNVSVLLAQKWTESVEPTGWWLSEKLDGVRAFWDGKTFFSRLGNEFIAPEWFLKGLPNDITLDGELFGGRGKFQSTVSIVKTAESSRWKNVKFCVFDAPSLQQQSFENRMKAVKEVFEKDDVPYAYALEHEKCRGTKHLMSELERIESLGGEGVMLREPKSKYVGARSSTLLKLKSFHDAEAVVIGYQNGKGRNAGVVGALVCRMAKGTVFKVGSGLNDQDRRKPPKKGSIITYRFQELSNGGNPRFPTYVGVRLDLDKPSDAVIPAKPTDA